MGIILWYSVFIGRLENMVTFSLYQSILAKHYKQNAYIPIYSQSTLWSSQWMWTIDRLLRFQSLAQYLSYPPHIHTPISHTNSFLQFTLYLSTAEPHISSLSLLTPFRRSHSLCSRSVHGCWYTVSFCTDREGQEHGVTYCPEHLCVHIKHSVNTEHSEAQYKYAPHNDFRSLTDRILTAVPQYYNTIVLQLPTAFSTVTCCTGLYPSSNRLYHIA